VNCDCRNRNDQSGLDGVDLAIMIGQLAPTPAWVARAIRRVLRIVVASSGYLKRRGEPRRRMGSRPPTIQFARHGRVAVLASLSGRAERFSWRSPPRLVPNSSDGRDPVCRACGVRRGCWPISGGRDQGRAAPHRAGKDSRRAAAASHRLSTRGCYPARFAPSSISSPRSATGIFGVAYSIIVIFPPDVALHLLGCASLRSPDPYPRSWLRIPGSLALCSRPVYDYCFFGTTRNVPLARAITTVVRP